MIVSSSFAEVPPTKIKADTLEYTGGIYTAKGNVVINQGNRILKSSEVTLDKNSGELRASGNVELEDGDNHLSSNNLLINIRTSFTSIDYGKMFIKEDNYHIEGEKIERLSEDRYRIKKATFTTCDGDPPCWRFKGKNINIHLNHFLLPERIIVSEEYSCPVSPIHCPSYCTGETDRFIDTTYRLQYRRGVEGK